ncbi:MAG: DeoR family transcriptional regulator, partial [Clostridia bacterium]|nr:DeoR family transcriptional regulator [Clostridia bacterium]
MEFSERQKKIIDLLSERSMSIMEIAKRLSSSEMTIRR